MGDDPNTAEYWDKEQSNYSELYTQTREITYDAMSIICGVIAHDIRCQVKSTETNDAAVEGAEHYANYNTYKTDIEGTV